MKTHEGCSHPPVSDETLKLVEEYEAKQGAWNHYQKAVAEARIWDTLSGDLRGAFKRQRRVALGHLIEGSNNYDLDLRDRLLQGGHLTDRFWNDLNAGKMPLATGVRLMRDARGFMQAQGLSPADAAEKAWQEYLKLPEIKLGDGKVVRRSTPMNLRKKPEVVAGRSAPRAKEEPEADEPPGTEREMWNRVRKAISAFAALKLSTLPEGILKDQMIIGMERDVKVLFEEWSNKIHRAKTTAKQNANVTRIVSRPTVLSACRTLHMDPPPVGKPVDLTLARRQKKKLAALYHPDSNAGDETTRPQYEGVLAAYAELEEFMEQAFPQHNPSAVKAQQ